jgi:hypothetical protein
MSNAATTPPALNRIHNSGSIGRRAIYSPRISQKTTAETTAQAT